MKLNPPSAEAARIALSGRLLRCPLGNNPADCPLHDVRQMPVEERITWLESLSNDEVIAFYLQHVRCLKSKVGRDPRFG